MAKKWIPIGLAATMVATLAVGCGDKKTDGGSSDDLKEKQELNLILTDELPTMDLSKATNTLSFTMFAQVSEGLIRSGKDGKPEAGVAEKWEVSPDGLTYTFHLREDAKWTNGDNVTAHDFEYSWKRTLNPDTGSQYSFMVAWVKGGTEYNAGKGSADDVAVKAKDDKTLEVTLDHPIPFFLEQMAFPIFYPQNKKFVEAQGDKYGADAATTLYSGPFKMTAWEHEQSAVIEKNDTYWNKDRVKLSKVNFQVVKDSNASVNLYESNMVDRTGLVRDQVDNYKSSTEFSTVPELTTVYLQYNQRVKALQSAKVRQALTWSVDGDAYADVIYHNGSVGAKGYNPLGMSNGQGGDFTKDVGDLINRKDNLPKAKATLAEGLKEAGVSEFPKIKLLADDGDVGKKAAEFVKEQWRQNLGIDVEVENVPYKLRLEKSHGHDFDIVISLWGADYNDPMTFLDMFISGGDFNDPQWSNKEYDELIKKAQLESDQKKRMNYLYDAEKLMMKEMPIGPVTWRGRAFITKPYVKDFRILSYGPDYDLIDTFIEGKE
ncbi:peptide ABC transporter substrate-binding protein [Tumebacillus lipolyticus]|uniref:Peptide ABC transporter substrate-binding protein n=1 Tax=Tumebacillus lipolyticus TaxID=1280370 RepID=A0ABW4ZYN0_9BACL